jgi:replicative DNA helicase
MLGTDIRGIMAEEEEVQRRQEVGRISRALKGLARDLGVPVVALSSFNRAVEYRGKDSEPTMADLRESGDLDVDQKHRDHIAARMEVWRKGYCLLCDVNGELYVYAATPK